MLEMLIALTIVPIMFLSVVGTNWILLNRKDTIERFCDEFHVGSDYGRTNKFGE